MKRESKNLGYGNTFLLVSQLEKVSKLLEVYTASILDSGTIEFPGGNPIQQSWLLTSDWIPAFAGMTTRGKPRGLKPQKKNKKY